MKKSNWISFYDCETVPCFKKSFQVKKDVKKAYLNITSMGFYLAKINNKEVTTSHFNPGWTSYHNRVEYQTYDVLSLLKKENMIEVMVAEGWGGARRLGWNSPYRPYYNPSINFEIVITYFDGEKEYIYSDEASQVFSTKILSSSIYDGEIHDERATSKYLGNAKYVNIASNIEKNTKEDIVRGEKIKALRMFRDPKGDLIIDFGQNFTGFVEVKYIGKKGDVISFTPGEVLDKNGCFYNENYRSAKSFYSFTLDGVNEVHRPLFSFMGGRYIKLIDYPKDIEKESFTGVLVHSNIKRTGDFLCGNELINQLYHNIIYGQLSNYLDIPTDCPQRDERLGWLGDAQVFCKTASINFDVLKFFRKWLKDMRLEQKENGAIEGVVPKIKGLDIMTACGWSDACTIIPWQLYLTYGDKSILEENYQMMVKWVKYLEGRGSNRYLWLGDNHFGDWLALDALYGESVGATNLDYLASAFYAHSVEILVSVSEVLEKDSSYYKDLYQNVKKEFISHFFKDGLPIGEKAVIGKTKEKTCYTQTALVIALYFGLYDNNKDKILNALIELINEAGTRMTTGFLGTPYILHVLSDNGHSDYAYNLLFQEKNPSWLFSVLHGATTIWEHYDGINEDGDFWSSAMNSFNHYAYGAVFDWIFENTLGIRLLKPGYKEVLIKVIDDKRLRFAKGSLKTKNGEIKVHWYYQDEHIVYEVFIPHGIKATFVYPSGEVVLLNEGNNRLYKVLD